MTCRFKSWLAVHFERFVALKRGGGADYTTQERLLTELDRYVDEQKSTSFTRETMIAFLATLDRLSPRSRDNVVNVTWQAIAFARLHGAKIEDLPPRPPVAPSHFRVRPPRLIQPKEIRQVIAAARNLPTHTSRPATFATLYGLLFVSGLRISEALSLDIGDLDFPTGLLTVKCGKFGKSRVLPLRPSTIAAIDACIRDPRRSLPRRSSDPIFESTRPRRLSHSTSAQSFKALCIEATIAPPQPCLHDIRHSFAVLTAMRWYQGQSDINALLPVLSTYLGHVSVENTRTYLRANALLLEQASQRFDRACAGLDEVLS